MFTETLTHVVNSSWNDYIYILLSLKEKNSKFILIGALFFFGNNSHTYRQAKLLKGWFDKCRILCENLLQISPSVHVSQNYEKKPGERSLGHGSIWTSVCVRRTVVHTSAREPDIRICVHKELHVEHFPHHLRVKDQNSFKEDDVCWVNRDPLFPPGNMHNNSDSVAVKKEALGEKKKGEIPPTWNESQSHMLALRLPFPRQCPSRSCTSTHCQRPLKFIKMGRVEIHVMFFFPHLGKIHKIVLQIWNDCMVINQ